MDLATGKKLWFTHRPVIGTEEAEDFKGSASGTAYVALTIVGIVGLLLGYVVVQHIRALFFDFLNAILPSPRQSQ